MESALASPLVWPYELPAQSPGQRRERFLRPRSVGSGVVAGGRLVLGFERVTLFPSAAVQERSSALVSHRVLAAPASSLTQEESRRAGPRGHGRPTPILRP